MFGGFWTVSALKLWARDARQNLEGSFRQRLGLQRLQKPRDQESSPCTRRIVSQLPIGYMQKAGHCLRGLWTDGHRDDLLLKTLDGLLKDHAMAVF
jgi:hypothetical protein